MSPATASFWCYSCTRFIHLLDQHDVVCPHCQSGFVEEIHDAVQSPAMSLFADGLQTPRRQGIRRRRRNAGSRSPFNPVIVLRGTGDDSAAGDADGNSSFELYYDDGDGSGLRPLPPTMSEFLLGSGFDRLLEQFSQIEINGFGRIGNPPAAKSSIESMPTIEISDEHVDLETHCAVCTEQFELGSEAREMPCKHLYHSDCIIPWLSLRNSCPVCRHELPSDQNTASENRINGQIDEADSAVGLTIWRLPGGGFAVGRFAGGRRSAETNLPLVYTEMDGGSGGGGGRNSNEGSRRISRAVGGSSRVRERGRIGRFFRNFVSLFGRFGSSRSESENGSMDRSFSNSSSVFNRRSRSRSTLVVED
ncbi:hypothetical protein RIF29_27814 [Crotalaria pallida]|uniref:RING-type E3 ubiquitin transferase n=1 Tax=Crotalaria pallida TaxID=3830 RepID=A0AAN9EQF8_CROPI